MPAPRLLAESRESSPVEILHDDVVPAALLPDLVRLDDVRMRELRSESRLVEEHGRERRLAGEARELHDEQLLKPTRALRAREVHVGHAALTEQSNQAVTTQRRVESGVRRLCTPHD